MQGINTPEAGAGASLSRRTFLYRGAGVAALAITPLEPAAGAEEGTALINEPSELAIDRIERLGQVLSSTLNEYANGKFYLTVYPQEGNDYPIALKSIAAERHRPSLEKQLSECVATLKSILSQMHPGCDDFGGGYVAHKSGGATVLIDARPRYAKWDGEGLYEILDYHRHQIDGVYLVSRHWSEMDRGFYLSGRLWADGEPVGLSEVIHANRIVRKLGGDVA